MPKIKIILSKIHFVKAVVFRFVQKLSSNIHCKKGKTHIRFESGKNRKRTIKIQNKSNNYKTKINYWIPYEQDKRH